MQFVDRKAELAFLEWVYHDPGFQLIHVYGLKRVGKTRPVQEFIRGREAISSLADRIAETEQFRGLGRMAGDHFDDPIPKDVGFKDWKQGFRCLKHKTVGGLVVVVDEFPYPVTSNKAVSSIFQKGIDEHLKRTDVFLGLVPRTSGPHF